MPPTGLTGSRIRERRLIAGIKQAALARTVGISAAYLNLIEHNRRRIAGKLLGDIAEALGVDAGLLAEGAEAGLVTALRDAAASQPDVTANLARAEEFAGRFPGWASVMAAQHRRIIALERQVEALSDRMAHDPHLAASLHDLLTTVTAINSTASILVDTGEIEDEWRDRFHRNIHEDSQRLAESSQAVVAYLDGASAAESVADSPQEELERWLAGRDYHLPEMERALAGSVATLLKGTDLSAAARDLAAGYLQRYRADAEQLPLAEVQRAAEECGYDPLKIADRFHVGIASVLRRLATMPTPKGAGRIGLVACDASGAVTFRKAVDGFTLPRFGAACPLWPLYQALGRPMAPVRALVELSGRDATRFLNYAIAQPVGVPGFDAPPVVEAVMLILPSDRVSLPDLPANRIGTSCRICPQVDCAARREASILAGASQVGA